MTNVLKSNGVRKAGIILQGLLIVGLIFAGGASIATLMVVGSNDSVIEDYQRRVRSLADANRELRELLRADLPPMRDTMEAHTQQITELTDRVDAIAGKADGAAKEAGSAAKAAAAAARQANQAGRSVGRAAEQVGVATEKVEKVVEQIMPPPTQEPADAPDWLDTP